MKHYHYFSLLLASLTIVVFSYTLITSNTYASAQGTPSPANNGCAVQMVHLNGKNPPTITVSTTTSASRPGDSDRWERLLIFNSVTQRHK